MVRGHLCHWLPVTPPGSMAATCQYPLVPEKRRQRPQSPQRGGGATSEAVDLQSRLGSQARAPPAQSASSPGRATTSVGGGIALSVGHATSGNGANTTMTAGASTEASCAGGTILLEAGVTAGGLGGRGGFFRTRDIIVGYD